MKIKSDLIDNFKINYPGIKLSHVEFNYNDFLFYFTDSPNFFEISEFECNSKTRTLLEKLIKDLHEESE